LELVKENKCRFPFGFGQAGSAKRLFMVTLMVTVVTATLALVSPRTFVSCQDAYCPLSANQRSRQARIDLDGGLGALNSLLTSWANLAKGAVNEGWESTS
jgi:hypothetical protein